MAGDWFPLQYWRSRCPEIVRVSSATGRTRHEVLGWVCDFWSWVSSESADGRVPGIRVSDLAEILGADAALWESLRAVGWIGEDAGGIVVPGWDAWLCESGKKRMKDAQRKRAERAEGVPTTPSPKRPRNVRGGSDKSPPTEQDRREEKKEPPNPRKRGPGREAEPLPEELLAAVAKVTGLDPATAAKELRTAAGVLAAADPPYTPAEVFDFGRRFHEICTWAVKQNRARPTPDEVRKRIGLIRAGPKAPAPDRRTKDAEILARRKREDEERAAAQATLAKLPPGLLGGLSAAFAPPDAT